MGLEDDGRTLCTILHMMARVRGSMQRAERYHVQGVHFCQLRREAWLCISCVL